MHATAAPPLPRLLTATDVADQLGLSRHRVFELCREGSIPFVRVGSRSLRFSAPALSHWIEHGGTSGPDGAE